jgi:hypothetical protein
MGRQALEVTHRHVPRAHGAVKEVAGYDTLFLRFYMKFHPEFPGVHHAGMYIRGGQPGALLDNPTGTQTNRRAITLMLHLIIFFQLMVPVLRKITLLPAGLTTIAIIWIRRIYMVIFFYHPELQMEAIFLVRILYPDQQKS